MKGRGYIHQVVNDLIFKTNGGGTTALTLDNSANATFASDVQAQGLYVGSTNTSFDFYNNGTTYLNGVVTIDAATTFTGTDSHINLDSNNAIVFDNTNNNNRYYIRNGGTNAATMQFGTGTPGGNIKMVLDGSRKTRNRNYIT